MSAPLSLARLPPPDFLAPHLVDVALRRQLDHDLQLLQLDIDGVIVLAEKDLRAMRQGAVWLGGALSSKLAAGAAA